MPAGALILAIEDSMSMAALVYVKYVKRKYGANQSAGNE